MKAVQELSKVFQFAPLREGRLACHGLPPPLAYFNSRPCVRGDAIKYLVEDGLAISIRAPA